MFLRSMGLGMSAFICQGAQSVDVGVQCFRCDVAQGQFGAGQKHETDVLIGSDGHQGMGLDQMSWGATKWTAVARGCDGRARSTR